MVVHRPVVGLFAGTLMLVLAGCSPDAERETLAPPPPAPPNIVFFIVDDLRHDALGATGHPFFQSPQIDRLADQGVLFDHMFVIDSLCSPSRATMLTGLYAHEHGVRNIWTPLPLTEPTVAGMLHDAGYETAWIGKWHLNATGEPHPDFDRWISFPAHGAYLNPALNIDGTVTPATGHMTDILTAEALAFIARPREAPFFLAVSHPAVHQPYVPQARFDGMHDGVEVQLPSTWDDGNHDKPEYLGCRAVDESAEQVRSLIRDYFDMLAGVDESLGLILDGLEGQGILDDTMVIFVGDNGYLLGEHGALDKRLAYEPSMRVPLMIRYPRWFSPGQHVPGEMALNLDLPITMLEAAGVEPPPSMRGLSLRALADGEAHRDDFVYHYYRDPQALGTPDIQALRTMDFKYVTCPGSFEPDELYDLVADPDESVNLATLPAWSEKLGQMRARLTEARREINDDSMGGVATREDYSWVARVFVDVIDGVTGAAVPNATVVTTASEPLFTGTAVTGANGRWYSCAKSAELALRFQLNSVSAPGYQTAATFSPVSLQPGAGQYAVTVRMRRAAPTG